MPQRSAVVRNGIVENVIIADPEGFNPCAGSSIIAADSANIGDSYANGVFTPLQYPSSHQTTGLTFLQFIDLFNQDEQAAIVDATDTKVRLFVLMATGAGQLDLSNQEVCDGVNYLAEKALIAPSRVSTILSGAKLS